MRKILVAAIALAVPTSADAELRALSRANCSPVVNLGANESVSYEPFAEWEIYVVSDQFHPIYGYRQFESDPTYYGWRAYAGCFGCGSSGWEVTGNHYVTANEGGRFSPDRAEWLNANCSEGHIASGDIFTDLCWITSATDCNLGSW